MRLGCMEVHTGEYYFPIVLINLNDIMLNEIRQI